MDDISRGDVGHEMRRTPWVTDGGIDDMAAKYTKCSHHNIKLSMFHIVQQLFLKQNRMMSLNMHYFFLLKNLRMECRQCS